MIPAEIRPLLLRIWGEQATQRADDWPDVQKRLFSNGYDQRVNAAVEELSRGFFPEDPPDDSESPPFDPVDCVFRAFSPLDAEHRRQLADALLAHRAEGTSPTRRAPPGPVSLHDDAPPLSMA
jgi:hypothetical protein